MRLWFIKQRVELHRSKREREIVLFIGTRFSNLYTSVHTPA
jgi:hypothetical protein